MNIITKIKNWLIKKLGGYTEEEYEKAKKIAWETGADYQKSIDGVWRTTACRMGANCNAEHEAYLALLNAYNTLAEQKQKPIEMAKAIKAYCGEHDTCEGCDLADESGLCKTPMNISPCCWEVE